MKDRDKNSSELADLGYYAGYNLTLKQQKFVLSYLKSGDREKAIRDAGYECSDENITRVAWSILNKPLVKKYIEKMRTDLEEKFKIEAEWILRRHEKIVNDFVPMDGNRCDPTEATVAQRSLDGICKMEGLYAAEKRTLEVSEFDPDIELAKKIARENAKEY